MPGRTEETFPPGAPLLKGLRENTRKFGIHLFDIGKDGNGIVHIVGPEQGLTLPGTTLVCGDSHTCTHGGMGSLAFGIGSSELEHVLATQTMVQRKPKRFRVQFEGKVPEGVTAKDMILHLIGDVGTAAGTGHAVEYAGSAVRGLDGRRPAHALQSVDRDGRAHRHGGAGRHHLRVPGRPRLLAQGRDVGPRRRALAHLAVRSRRRFRPRAHDRHGQGGAADHLGHQPRARDRRRPGDPRSRQGTGGQAGGLDGGAAVPGAGARQADRGHQGRLGVHRLVHQQPHLRPARRRGHRQGPAEGAARECLDRAGLRAREARGRGRGAGPHLQGRGLRMARAGLLDVHRLQRRARAAGAAQCVDVQPQLRRPARPRRAHPSRQPGHGRGGGDQGRDRRREEALEPPWKSSPKSPASPHP